MTSPDDDRLTRLEMLVMHLQHDVEQQHEALLAQQKELRELRAALARLQRHVELSNQTPEDRDPLSEIPPHH